MASVKNSFEEVKAYYLKMRLNRLIVFLILLVGVILGWFVRELTLIPAVAAIAVWLFVYRPSVKGYVSFATEKNLEQTVGRRLYGSKITEKGGTALTPAMVRQAELVPVIDKAEVLCLWQVDGTWKRIPVVSSDATAPIYMTLPDGKKKGNYLTGVWTRAELPKDTGADLRLIDRGSGLAGDAWYAAQGLAEVPSEADPEFFSVLAPENIAADPAAGKLPKGFYEAVKALMEKTSGSVLISLRGKELNIFVTERFLTYRIRTNVMPVEEVVTFDPFPEYDKVLALIEAAAGEKTA